MRSFFLSLCALAMLAFGPANATDLIVHKLQVAVSPGVEIDESDVDRIISEMNHVMVKRHFDWTWDRQCSDIKFERQGPLIKSAVFLTNGNYADLKANLQVNAPQAEVLIVLGIKCPVNVAAGCSPVGGEPLIVAYLPDEWKKYNAQLWLHERGHNMGLSHSADGGNDSDYSADIGLRFMFWQIGDNHIGKTESDCKAFRSAKFASVTKEKYSGGVLAAAFPATTANSPVPVGEVSPQATVSPTSSLGVADVTSPYGLTKKAFSVIGYPWVGGIPSEAIKGLDETDLNSIRAMLRTNPNVLWPQALNVLGINGDTADVPLVKNVLAMPLPAAFPGQNVKDAVRQISLIKLTAPIALGLLASRTGSADAVEALKNASKSTTISLPNDRVINRAVQKSALEGLALAGTVEARNYVKAVVDLQSGAQLQQPIDKAGTDAARAVPLTDQDKKSLIERTEKINKDGLEKFLNPTR